MKPLYKGQVRDGYFVLCRKLKLVLFSEVTDVYRRRECIIKSMLLVSINMSLGADSA